MAPGPLPGFAPEQYVTVLKSLLSEKQGHWLDRAVVLHQEPFCSSQTDTLQCLETVLDVTMWGGATGIQ